MAVGRDHHIINAGGVGLQPGSKTSYIVAAQTDSYLERLNCWEAAAGHCADVS
jgi:hypothetical protein